MINTSRKSIFVCYNRYELENVELGINDYRGQEHDNESNIKEKTWRCARLMYK